MPIPPSPLYEDFDRDFVVRLKAGAIEGRGSLTWLRGDEIGVCMRSRLRRGLRFQIQIRDPIEDISFEASFRVGRSSREDDRYYVSGTLCDLGDDERRALLRLLHISASSARSQRGLDLVFAPSTHGRRLQISWSSPEAFLRSCRYTLEQNQLTLPPLLDCERRVSLLLALPDGQRFQISARRVGDQLRFRLHYNLKHKLRKVIEWCEVRSRSVLDTPAPFERSKRDVSTPGEHARNAQDVPNRDFDF